MKHNLSKILRKEETQEKFHMLTTICMIILFLTFWGVSFYVLVNSFA